MAKKKVTKKKTVKKTAPKSGVNKTQEIKKALAATPGKSPKEISEALTAKGIEISPAYVSKIKTNLKAKAAVPVTQPLLHEPLLLCRLRGHPVASLLVLSS